MMHKFSLHESACLKKNIVCVSLAEPTPESSGCSKCATAQKSGKLTCCAWGGSWYGTCGNPDNPNVDHTWSEGVNACKRFQASRAGPIPWHELHQAESISRYDGRLPDQKTAVSQQSHVDQKQVIDPGVESLHADNASYDKLMITVIATALISYCFT